jgi:signal transduction histidine kinase
MGSSMTPQAGHTSAPPADQQDALPRLLAMRPLPRGEIAACVVADPPLLHAVLHACPLEGSLQRPLTEEVADRIDLLGPDLLGAWLSAQGAGRNTTSRTDFALRGFAARSADIALRLAIAAGYPRPEEARLAALWSRLSQMLRLDPAWSAISGSPATLNARLAEECGAFGPLSDALMQVDASEEQVLTAHPLTRLLWSALRLAAGEGATPITVLARVAGVDGVTLERLRDETTLPASHAPGDQSGDMLAQPTAPPATRELVEAAIAGYAQRAFAGLDGEALRARLTAGTRLLCAIEAALVVVARDGVLEALPLAAERIATNWNAAPARLDDPSSVIALAARSATPTSYHRDDGDAAQRSLRDWQLARWIGRNGFVCVPFSCGEAPGTIVVAPERVQMPAPDATRRLLALVSTAANVASAQHSRKLRENALQAEIAARYRDHARRIAHEARNPLSVIRSYLQLIPQRDPELVGLAADMALVEAEIDRLRDLIDASCAPPQEASEPAVCHVTELLRDLRALIGESLFGKRGIHFELRSMAGLPPAALPASVLRQVLLNLLHNAADILHPGGRCTLALAGEVFADGIRCIEIRVIDNGPGLPPERLANPFAPAASSKGGHHQGLGLAISHELLSEWHGRILCRSQSGVGTSFQLLVPAMNSE